MLRQSEYWIVILEPQNFRKSHSGRAEFQPFLYEIRMRP
jgi:hypothetical protein